MKFEVYGKIVTRTMRKVKGKSGDYDLYNITVEEPGIFPNRFQLGTKSPSMLGDKDGSFAVGKWCRATGFTNGFAREAMTKDGRPFTAYQVTFTLREIASAMPPPESGAANPDKTDATGVADDVPY